MSLHPVALDVFKADVAEWLDEHETTESITWDASMIAMPDPQQQGLFHPVILLAITMANPILGNPPLSFTALCFNLAPGKQFVADSLVGMLEQIRQMRTALLSQSNGHAHPSSLRP